jgi:stage III sporulation protein SpoIIIAA
MNNEELTEPETTKPEIVKQEITSNIDLLLQSLPPHISTPLERDDHKDDLLEIVMDLGRLPEARFRNEERFLSDREVTREDIEYVTSRIGNFGEDNRAGIQRTLHRISALRNRSGIVIGLTCRVGRAVYGTITLIRNLVEDGASTLLLGKPGVGKTTLLREVARVLADELRKRVVIVDTSNEIAGDGDIPHPGIGRARRMQVSRPSEQHAVMIEAVENHMPEVIIIDEIGTELEAQAARTIAERGVQLVGTAHGNTLENLMLNPTLSDLIGGIQAVTLGDEEARRRGTQKTVLERKAPPTFNVLVEIQSWDEMTVYTEVDAAVDAVLRGEEPTVEMRKRDADGQVHSEHGRPERGRESDIINRGRRGGRMPMERDRGERMERDRGERVERDRHGRGNGHGPGLALEQSARRRPEREPAVRAAPERVEEVRIFPFGISRNRLEKAIERLRLPATLVRELDEATVVLTLKNYYRANPARLRHAEDRSMPIYVLRSNTQGQMETILANIFDLGESGGEEGDVQEAMEETEEAIGRVMNGQEHEIELAPASSFIRRLQHQMAERYNLQSESTGKEPRRRVRIFRA